VASPETTLLRGTGVSRRFERGGARIVAIEGASFAIDTDSRIALVGPSGSGKSTLLHLMAGLLDPSAGSVSWPALDEAGDGRAGAIAVVFQAPSLVPWLDAVENVMVPLLLKGLDENAARREAEAALGVRSASPRSATSCRKSCRAERRSASRLRGQWGKRPG
jgi:ABC-type nitrate/sulfonate/bicarbonate transport system ATPase subunit